jgi:hypothetical protein
MKRKKIYYIPGLISLIGLPILFFFFPIEDPIQKCAVRFSIPSDAETKDSVEVFSKYSVKKAIENKKIVTIDMGEYYFDEPYLTNSKFNFVHNEIERLQFTHDTSTLLKVQLRNNNTYGDFMWLLNQALIYRVKRYALVDNDFYILTNPPPINYDSITVEPLYAESFPVMNHPTKWDIFKWRLQYKLSYIAHLIKLNSTLCIGFFILIIIPFIFSTREMIKKRNQLLP